jgi:hypothetical protein
MLYIRRSYDENPEPPEPDPHAAFIVQSNLDVVATDVTCADQLKPERYAQRTAGGTWGLDRGGPPPSRA